MPKSLAWLLTHHQQTVTAVGKREMIHLLPSPPLFKVPDAPFYCQNVLTWEGKIIPVLDLAAWLYKKTITREKYYVAIVAYQSFENQDIEYGGLLLTESPDHTEVDDKQACELPESPENWQKVAISCFSDKEQVIPVLDIPVIFSSDLRMTL